MTKYRYAWQSEPMEGVVFNGVEDTLAVQTFTGHRWYSGSGQDVLEPRFRYDDDNDCGWLFTDHGWERVRPGYIVIRIKDDQYGVTSSDDVHLVEVD